MTALAGSIQLWNRTAAEWTADNPILKDGQPGIETDTRQIKIGDGITAWNSIAYWKEPIAGTWSVIKALKDAGTLIPGQLYRITDFATVHIVPNTGGLVTNTGATEALTLIAISASTFDEQVLSSDYPQDILFYEITDTSTAGGTKGRIRYRKDTLLNIEMYEDWRNVKYRRWETAFGTGIYTATSDPGGGAASIDRYIFNNTQAATNTADVSIGRKTSGDQLCNITFGTHTGTASQVFKIKMGEDNTVMCFGCNTSGNIGMVTIGRGNTLFTIGAGSTSATNSLRYSLEIGDNNSTITIADNIMGATGAVNIGKFNTWKIGSANQSITLPSTLVSSTATGGRSFELGSGFSTLTFSDAAYSASGQYFKKIKGQSTFKKTITIANGAVTIAYNTDVGLHIGDVTITSSTASETISSITGTVDGEVYIIRAASGKTYIFPDGTFVMSGAAAFTVQGTNGDFLIFENRSGVLFQIAGENY